MTQPVHEAEAERLEQLAAEEADLQAGERDAAAALLQSAEDRGRSIERLLAAAHVLRHGSAGQSDPATPVPTPGAGPLVDPPGSEPGGAPASSLVTTGEPGGTAPADDRDGASDETLPCGHPQDAVRGTAGGPGGTRHCGVCSAAPGDPLATTAQDRILAGAALGRARAAEPTTCPDCGRSIARGQLPGHRGTQSCSLEQKRRRRAAERKAVLAAPVSDAPLAKPKTVILGGSVSRLIACDLCGREMPQAAMRPHRGRGRCRATQEERRAAAATEAAAKVEPMVVLPLSSRPQRRPLRAEDVPSSIMGQQVAPGALRGVAASLTRAIGASPERVGGDRAPSAMEVMS